MILVTDLFKETKLDRRGFLAGVAAAGAMALIPGTAKAVPKTRIFWSTKSVGMAPLPRWYKLSIQTKDSISFAYVQPNKPEFFSCMCEHAEKELKGEVVAVEALPSHFNYQRDIYPGEANE